MSMYAHTPYATGVPSESYRYSGVPYDAANRYPASYAATGYLPRAALIMAGVGALVGGTAAAAKNIRQVREARIDRRQAVRDTARETAGAAVATGVATFVVGYASPGGNLLSLLGTVAIATGTKYLWDGATAGTETCACAHSPAETTAAE